MIHSRHVKAAAARTRTLVRAHATGRTLPAGEAAARVRAGLPVGEFDALRELLGLTVEDLARRVGVSIATLSRRRHGRQPLDASQSDRLLRFARLFRLATELHDGDADAARAWLGKPARALDGETPLDRAETEAGTREVESLIGRLEHGVYT
jgi:putative toxin-antitoxin system antitoxin component (TIGR02293 family)